MAEPLHVRSPGSPCCAFPLQQPLQERARALHTRTPPNQLIAVGHGPTAATVLINGRIVMRKGRSTLLDEDAVVVRAYTSAKSVASRLGLNQPGKWTRS